MQVASGGTTHGPSTSDGTAGTASAAAGVSATAIPQAGGGAAAGGVGATSSAGTGNLAGTTNEAGTGNLAGANSAGFGDHAGAGSSRRKKVCDTQGNCHCHNLALLGAPANSAESGTTSADSFSAWLRDKSNATVQLSKAPQPLTRDFLNALDVIVLQDLRAWALTSQDIANFAEWVQSGGGVIALSGYMNNDDTEVEATNALIGFTGVRLNGGGIAGSVPGSVCPTSTRTICPLSSGQCCYCWGNTIPVTAWATSHPVASGLSADPAFMGRSVDISTDGRLVADFESKAVAATKSVGLGILFLFGDDAVTYRRQWSGGYTPSLPLPGDPCYLANATPPHWLTSDYVFQTKQFWYNAIRYVAPTTECDFVITEPEIQLW